MRRAPETTTVSPPETPGTPVLTAQTTPVVRDDADDTDTALLQRLRAAAELLEQVGADHSLLDTLPGADRDRLQRAVARVYHPDPAARRLRLKIAERERHAQRINREIGRAHV